MSKKSTKLSALQDMFQENQISPDKIELSNSIIIEMKKKADVVPDYRHPSYIRHLLW